MQEIVDIGLDNEMDLILAHKRTMKLAELCGLSLSAQTTFATAVSEIARSSITYGSRSKLSLGIRTVRLTKDIVATISDNVDLKTISPEPIRYASKLNGNMEFSEADGRYFITMSLRIPLPGTISPGRIETFKEYFKNEPPLSPYDEIRKKNIQLIELTAKIRESENQYRILTDTLPIMMFALDLASNVTYTNKWLSEHMPVATQLKMATWRSLLHEEDYRTVAKGWEEAQASQTFFRSQARLKQKGSNHFLWHLINILPVRNEQQEVNGYIGFFVDIHAQKLIEETLKDNKELRNAQEKLKLYQHDLEQKISELNASNHDLEQFAYIASHDLQEPLRKIKTFTALLQDSLSLEGKQQEYFNKIIRSSGRMSDLIRDVLDYSRLSKPEEQLSETNLNELIDHILFDFELLIQDRKAQVHAEALPVIKGIRPQLIQLFSNLMSNALKFSEEQPVIEISAKTVEQHEIPALLSQEKGTGFHEITFRDHGIGFEPQYAEQIFTIFQRLNGSQTYTGTGIGLAMCKKIMSNHQGLIMAESKLGEGAVFKLYFPREKPDKL